MICFNWPKKWFKYAFVRLSVNATVYIALCVFRIFSRIRIIIYLGSLFTFAFYLLFINYSKEQVLGAFQILSNSYFNFNSI